MGGMGGRSAWKPASDVCGKDAACHPGSITERNHDDLIFSKLFKRGVRSDEAPTETAPASRPSRPPRRQRATTEAGPEADRQSPPPRTASAEAESPDGPPRRRRRRGGRGRNKAATEGAPTVVAAPRARTPEPEPVSYDGELPEAFAELGVDEIGLKAVGSMRFTTPTPIQREAIPELYDGHDVVGLAQTGTGKTIAFGLPLARSINPDNRDVQALVLVPTRELATQVLDVMDHLGRFYGFATLGLMGGKRLQTDFTRLEAGSQVVVGTPGRVMDHIRRGTLNLGTVHYVILDEADQMLDIGFARDIDYILRKVPRQRQTALFSATMPMSIRKIVYQYMQRPKEIAIEPEQRTAEGIKQLYCEVAERDKIKALRYLYEEMDLGRSLIFRRTKIGVDRLTQQLQDAGLGARAIHGDLRQSERDRVMRDFRGGSLQFLVATNVAARGLDIPDIEHVINFDVPQNAEEYIHRIGRTARAGKTGSAVTFVGEWELQEWDAILADLGEQPEHLEIPARLN